MRTRSARTVWHTAAITALAMAMLVTRPAKADSFGRTGPLLTPRGGHTTTLLANGKVLVAGGHDPNTIIATTEVYDPVTGAWTSTGPMSATRAYHSATLLPNGKVLVAGGRDSTTFFASVEVYDPVTGVWTPVGAMATGRSDCTATLLPNGQVLVVGGWVATVSAVLIVTNSAELFNPATGTWTPTGALNVARRNHTATLLPNGWVLVAGGTGASSELASAELYNPATGTWVFTGPMTATRWEHTATLLPNGTVIAAGGFGYPSYRASAEIYDPSTGAWTSTGSMAVARYDHTSTLLPNGKVLVAGGANDVSPFVLADAELYDPGSGTWSAASPLLDARFIHTATLLANGKVLVAGGFNDTVYLSSAELYDYASSSWTPTGATYFPRMQHTSTLLPTGKVLAAGGYDSGPLAGAELYDQGAGTWGFTGSLITARHAHTATLLVSGKVLAAGGLGPGALASAERYDPATGNWATAGAMNNARYFHTASLLGSGRVLVAGGQNNAGTPLASAELYDPAGDAWTPANSLSTARYNHAATVLSSGKALVTGGSGAGGALAATEVYDPVTQTWSPGNAMTTPRSFHTATLLLNGKVLVAGGDGSTGAPGTAELYDPATGTWTSAGSLNTPRWSHRATLLPNGKVLVAGGYNTVSQWLVSSELYDPATELWTPTGPLSSSRTYFTAILLPNGKVLAVGGSGSAGFLASTELYDIGLGFSPAWQPQITAFNSPLVLGNSLMLKGSQFRGNSEGSGGNSTQDSPADYPVVQLRSIESGQTLYTGVTNWSASAANSPPIINFPQGWALVTAFVNGIPSVSGILLVTANGVSAHSQPAGQITSHSAALNGRVNPSGLNSTAWFEWGTTFNTANTTPLQPLGNGTNDVAVTQALSSLLPNTTYYFQLVVSNSTGLSYGGLQSFVTATLGGQVFTDSFGSGLNETNWMVLTTETNYLVDTSQGNLSLSMPGGGSVGANHAWVIYRFKARGDFDVHVDFTNASLALGGNSGANQVELDAQIGSQFLALSRDDEPGPGQTVHVWLDPPGQAYNYQSTSASAGTLRILRAGATVSAYFNSTLIYQASFNTNDATFRLMLQNYYTTDPISVAFKNFFISADELIPPQIFTDSFAGGFNQTNWLFQATEPLYSLDTSQGNARLSMPRGGSVGAQDALLVFRYLARGDFDVHVDFTNASLALGTDSGENQIELDAEIGPQFLGVSRSDDAYQGQNVHLYASPPGQWYGTQPISASYGTLRLTRVGATVSAYFNSTLLYQAVYNTEEAIFRLTLQNYYTTDPISVTFDNFSVSADQLIPYRVFSDGFCSGVDPMFWTIQSNQSLYFVQTTNCGVVFSKPAGTGTNSGFQSIALALKSSIQGDFDVQVGMSGAGLNHLTGSPGNQVQLNCTFGGQFFAVARSDETGAGQNVHVYAAPPGAWFGAQSTSDTSGTLRVTRSGTLLSGYFNSTLLYQANYNSNDVTITCSLQNNGTSDATAVTFGNFQLLANRIAPVPLCIHGGPAGHVVVSWPDWVPNAVLQSATNLAAPTWQIVSNVPTRTVSWLFVTNNTLNPAQFYRLDGQ